MSVVRYLMLNTALCVLLVFDSYLLIYHLLTYIHSYIHKFIHTYIHKFIHTYIYTYIHIYIHTYILTPCSRVLLEKLTGSQQVKKFPAFYRNRRFISAFTSARNLSLS